MPYVKKIENLLNFGIKINENFLKLINISKNSKTILLTYILLKKTNFTNNDVIHVNFIFLLIYLLSTHIKKL